MREKTIENKIKKYLKENKIWYFKVWGGGYQTAGIPDIIACYKGHFIAIEVKSEIGKTTTLQDFNLQLIKSSGGISIVARSVEDVKEVLDNITAI